MADEKDTDDAETSDASEDEDTSEGGGNKKLLMIIVLTLLVIVGGLAGAYFTGLLDPVVQMITGGEVKEKEGEGGEQRAVFYDLQEILVNLNTGGRKSSFLKIRISLELERASDVPLIESVMPRVIDNFQVYLRELRIDDLRGSAGMYRLREELMRRVSAATAPAGIKDVLFKEMLVQ